MIAGTAWRWSTGVPAHLRADAVTFHHIMQTAPREALDFGEVIVDAQFVAELDRALAEAGTDAMDRVRS